MKKRYIRNMINWNNAKYYEYPYNHIVIDDCFDTSILEGLQKEWPSEELGARGAVMGGRRQMSNMGSNKPAVAWMNLKAPVWKSLCNYLNDDVLLDEFKARYSDDMKRWGCVLNENDTLDNGNMFLHIDWSEGGDGYTREIHADSGKRFLNFLIFFNDKQWNGGDFVIHSSDAIKTTPIKHVDGEYKTGIYPRPAAGYATRYTTEVAPVHKVIEGKTNRAVFFLSTPDSLHSVSTQTNTSEYRKFIYGAYSLNQVSNRGGYVFGNTKKL